MSRRQIKKRILAEALKLYREHQFEAQRFTMARTGETYDKLVHVELKRPFDILTDLMHECACLEGDRRC